MVLKFTYPPVEKVVPGFQNGGNRRSSDSYKRSYRAQSSTTWNETADSARTAGETPTALDDLLQNWSSRNGRRRWRDANPHEIKQQRRCSRSKRRSHCAIQQPMSYQNSKKLPKNLWMLLYRGRIRWQVQPIIKLEVEHDPPAIFIERSRACQMQSIAKNECRE
jgi:hypothetical protein